MKSRAAAGVRVFVRIDSRPGIRVKLELRIDPRHADRLGGAGWVAGVRPVSYVSYWGGLREAAQLCLVGVEPVRHSTACSCPSRLSVIDVDSFWGGLKMRALRLVVALVVLTGLVGCGASRPHVMPPVVGLKLDVALSDIERAGFSKEVEVLGGGIFGVLDKSNWTVCDQQPAAGVEITDQPRLTVDRACGEASAPSPATTGASAPSPAGPSSAVAPSSAPGSEPSAATPSTLPVLTVANDPDFAAIAELGDYCGASIAEFAEKNAGRTIQFDGSVGALNNHGSYKTRYDILVNFGDEGQGTKGPAFQFRDVSITGDLNLTGANIPASMSVGDNLRLTATVIKYEEQSCLLLLDPVSTEYR